MYNNGIDWSTFTSFPVIIFIILGLAAFVFEDYFKPKIYEAEGVGIGYIGDITLKVKAYKKKDKTIRVIDIEVEHADTHEIGGVCCTKLVEDIKEKDYDLLFLWYGL